MNEELRNPHKIVLRKPVRKIAYVGDQDVKGG
jgi:hypothetical protein